MAVEERLINALKHLGITTRWLLIILSIIAIFFIYKNILQIKKLHLEIAQLQKINKHNNQ